MQNRETILTKFVLISLLPTVTKTGDGDDEVLNELIHLMDKSMFKKSEFRRSEDIYRLSLIHI